MSASDVEAFGPFAGGAADLGYTLHAPLDKDGSLWGRLLPGAHGFAVVPSPIDIDRIMYFGMADYLMEVCTIDHEQWEVPYLAPMLVEWRSITVTQEDGGLVVDPVWLERLRLSARADAENRDEVASAAYGVPLVSVERAWAYQNLVWETLLPVLDLEHAEGSSLGESMWELQMWGGEFEKGQAVVPAALLTEIPPAQVDDFRDAIMNLEDWLPLWEGEHIDNGVCQMSTEFRNGAPEGYQPLPGMEHVPVSQYITSYDCEFDAVKRQCTNGQIPDPIDVYNDWYYHASDDWPTRHFLHPVIHDTWNQARERYLDVVDHTVAALRTPEQEEGTHACFSSQSLLLSPWSSWRLAGKPRPW